MKLIFCGGAGEVGASCYLVNIDGKNILLDCGIRLSTSKDNLPDFRLIQENGGIDAILVSHAHTDHTGALPAISRQFSNANIYMTHMTKDLTRVLLYDSLKIMERGAEIPIYAENHVQEMLDKSLCYSPEYTFKPFKDSEIAVTFYNAGHVAGAVSIYITGKAGSLFYSGDFSGFRQNTVEGAMIPKLRPDVAIIESTYGDKLHSNRQIEENRLIDAVAKILAQGGKVLIPAFALGRAQEIILIIRRAMNKGILEKSPVYIDGMIKDICRVYKQNPNYLRLNLAKKVFKGTEIFYDEKITPVENNDMRKNIVSKAQPCIIISSSGMMTGGPSQFYAEKLALEEKNFIAITGYQDEESPGRELLKLLDPKIAKEDRFITLGNKKVTINCGVGRYGLSAHGDLGEILGLVNNIYPRKIFLVHGNEEVIFHLGKELQRDINAKVFAPSNGEIYDVKIATPRKQPRHWRFPLMNKENVLTKDNIDELWKFVVENIGCHKSFTSEELLKIWGKGMPIDDFKRLLNETIYFEPDKKRLFLFRAVDKAKIKELRAPKIMELNEMLAFVDEYFGPETGLYKRGGRYQEKIALLSFNFPQVALKKYKDKIKEFEKKSGWKVEINTNIDTMAINDVVNRLFKDFTIEKISYMGQDGIVKVSLKEEILSKDLGDEIKKFKHLTGLSLIINEKAQIPIEKSRTQMEQNEALRTIDKAFAASPHRPYKKSVKTTQDGRYIELSFISKSIGEKYIDIIEKLEEETGYTIVISDSCNQIEIIKIAKALAAEKKILLKKNPSIFLAMGTVEISPSEAVNESVYKNLSQKFHEETGFILKLK